jgi:hypothetical protein
MRFIVLISLLTMLTLTTSAEEITTNNLITNGKGKLVTPTVGLHLVTCKY